MTFPATLPGAALAGKAATGLALAALAVGGAGAVTIAATASSAHANVSAPATTTTQTQNNGKSTAFGQQVKAQVATCKAALQSGQHGIGSCVSIWVTAHNPANNRPGAPTTGAPANLPSTATSHSRR